MLFFGVCFFLYLIKLSAGNGFFLPKAFNSSLVHSFSDLRWIKSF